jgi:hypothetical protein
MDNFFDSLSLPPTSLNPQENPPSSHSTMSLSQAQKQIALQQYVMLQSQRQAAMNSQKLSPSPSSQSLPSPVVRPQRPATPQQTTAVVAMQRMAQHIILQLQKVEESLKKPNLDAVERNNLLGYKAKFEHDLQALRNAANGNNPNLIQNNPNARSKLLQNNLNRNPMAPNTNAQKTMTSRMPSNSSFSLPAGPPLFPHSPQLNSKLFKASNNTDASPMSPRFRPIRSEKRLRDDLMDLKTSQSASKPKKIENLLKRIAPNKKLDTETETVRFTYLYEKKMLELADTFIDTMIHRACEVAKNRDKGILEIQDFQVELGIFSTSFHSL